MNRIIKNKLLSTIKNEIFAVLIISLILLFLSNKNSFGAEQTKIERRTIHSKILNENRIIYISPYPKNNDKKKYPVLYILDAYYNTRIAIGIADYLYKYKVIPQIIIVGIGNKNRIRDMTPTKSVMEPESGGAENFNGFIIKELIPYIDKNLPSSSERILMGHSLGGLLTLYSLINTPEMFNSYIAISPSINWNNSEYPPVIESFFKAQKKLNGFLFISLANEGRGDGIRMLKKLHENILLNVPENFKLKCKYYPDNSHITVLPLAISDSLSIYFNKI